MSNDMSLTHILPIQLKFGKIDSLIFKLIAYISKNISIFFSQNYKETYKLRQFNLSTIFQLFIYLSNLIK